MSHANQKIKNKLKKICNLYQRLRATFTYTDFLQINAKKKTNHQEKNVKGSIHINANQIYTETQIFTISRYTKTR